MLKSIKNLSNFNKIIYSAAIAEVSQASLDLTDNTLSLDSNGTFKMLIIKFKGSVLIYNKLPNGYSIRLHKNTIRITNLLGRSLRPDNKLFDFDGSFSIVGVKLINFSGFTFDIEVNDINKLKLINNSKTNLEDSTLLFVESYEEESLNVVKSKIDDDSIKGLQTKSAFKNGYTGYYNYSPSKNVFATGKQITNQSTPIGKNKVEFAKNIIKKQNIKIKTSGAIYKEPSDVKLKRDKKLLKTKEIKRGKY